MLLDKVSSELIYKAGKNLELGRVSGTASLMRNVYFLCDEFANLPKIERMDTKITAARSRRIWFILIIQSYAQLDHVYGKDVSKIIQGNCDINMFIGTTDNETLDSWSKRCGNCKVSAKSMSRAEGNKVSENYSVQTRPLIYASELAELNKAGKFGNTIVSLKGDKPIKSKFLQAHTSTHWILSKTHSVDTDARVWRANEYRSDIKDRNDLISDLLELGEIDKKGNIKIETEKKESVKVYENNLKTTAGEYKYLERWGIYSNDNIEIMTTLESLITKFSDKKNLIQLSAVISDKLRYLASINKIV